MHDEHCRGRSRGSPAGADREAAAVHVRLRLQQHEVLPSSEPWRSRPGSALRTELHAVLAHERVDEPESRVVTREPVFGPGLPSPTTICSGVPAMVEKRSETRENHGPPRRAARSKDKRFALACDFCPSSLSPSWPLPSCPGFGRRCSGAAGGPQPVRQARRPAALHPTGTAPATAAAPAAAPVPRHAVVDRDDRRVATVRQLGNSTPAGTLRSARYSLWFSDGPTGRLR